MAQSVLIVQGTGGVDHEFRLGGRLAFDLIHRPFGVAIRAGQHGSFSGVNSQPADSRGREAMNGASIVPCTKKTGVTNDKRRHRGLHALPITLTILSVCCAGAGVIAQDNDRERNLAASLASLDPGPRPGFVLAPNPYPNFPNNPGNPIQGLTTSGQFPAFQGGLTQFIEVEPVDLAGGPGNGGLGPTFNSNSCGSCHSQPAAGGTSPRADVGPAFLPNPQATVGQGFAVPSTSQIITFGNATPFFVTPDGPVREA